MAAGSCRAAAAELSACGVSHQSRSGLRGGPRRTASSAPPTHRAEREGRPLAAHIGPATAAGSMTDGRAGVSLTGAHRGRSAAAPSTPTQLRRSGRADDRAMSRVMTRVMVALGASGSPRRLSRKTLVLFCVGESRPHGV